LWDENETPGLDRFVTHLDRLASYYSPGEETNFNAAVGFIWGSIPYHQNRLGASVQMAVDPQAVWRNMPYLYEGTANWKPSFVDDGNPSHHYAGLFYAGYAWGQEAGIFSNWLRDGPLSGNNPPDLILGNIAAIHGNLLWHGAITMGEVGQAVRYALDARPGWWSGNAPGR
jgi:hypothetical protein